MRKFGKNIVALMFALIFAFMSATSVQAKDTIKKRDVYGATIIIPILKEGNEINNYVDFTEYCGEPESIKYTAMNGKVYREQQMVLALGHSPHSERLTVSIECGRNNYDRTMGVKSIDYVSLSEEQAQRYVTNLKIDTATGTATFRGAVYHNGAYWKCILKYKDVARLK